MNIFKRILQVCVTGLSVGMIYWYVISGMVNIGTIAGIVFFLVVGSAAVFFDPIVSFLKKRWGKRWIRILTLTVLILFGLLIVWCTSLLCMMGYYADREPPSDVTVVVLGCQVNGDQPSLMLSRRLEAARKKLVVQPQAPCIVSGGQGSNESLSEAECMYRWLTAHGIEPSRIYREDRSFNTEENLSFSAEIIRENHLPQQLAIVTDGFHEMRAALLAQERNLICGAVPAETPLFLSASFTTRELLALTAEILLP